MNARTVEQIKLLVIVFLSCTALILGSQVYTSGNIFSNLPNGSEVLEHNTTVTEAARPLSIAITNEHGLHCAVKYDAEQLETSYANVKMLFGEALGSAGDSYEATVYQWETALQREGVFLDFEADIPLRSIARWTGAETSETKSARYLCISVDGETADLYFMNDSRDNIYVCSTAVQPVSIKTEVEKYLPNDAQFAFEIDGLESTANPYLIFIQDMQPIQTVYATSSLYTQITEDMILKAFGMDSYVVPSYTEKDGTRVFVEVGGTMVRLLPEGIIVYDVVEYEDASLRIGYGDEDYISSIIEGACQFAQQIIGNCCGIADIQFSGIFYDENKGEYTVQFDYYINGIRVLVDGNAAEITVREGFITEAKLFAREYQQTDQIKTIIPELQAVMIMDSISPGSEVRLSYQDSLNNEMEPEWLAY